jgi:O-antigen ligase/polysaccharide polymerase Wzy-like membrane protein
MSTSTARMAWNPGFGAWMVLAALIAVGVLGNWLIAAGMLILYLRQVARPFDFLTSFLLVSAGASFIRYEAGQLTLELALLSGLIVFMLVSYAVSNPSRLFVLPRTSLVLPLMAYVGLSLANYLRGLWVGSSPNFATLELMPVLALGSGILVANVFDPRRDLRLATIGLFAIGYVSASLGYYFFAVYHVRAAGVFFLPIPGMIAMFAVNLALRSPRTASALGWCLLSLPLFLHQFISFTRGYWLGCMAGLLASLVAYVRWGKGAGPSWRRSGLVLGTLVCVGSVGAMSLGLIVGRTDFLTMAGSRFASVTATEFTHETASNLARIAEYAEVVTRIAAAPWLGHGLGYTFTFQEPIGFEVAEQWYTHQIYLFVWLKQGLIGLLVFVWMLWSATTFCARESRRNENPLESAWLATAAACTVLLAVLGLSNFHLMLVNETFPLAFLWGGAMAIARDGFFRFQWADPPRTEGGARS